MGKSDAEGKESDRHVCFNGERRISNLGTQRFSLSHGECHTTVNLNTCFIEKIDDLMRHG